MLSMNAFCASDTLPPGRLTSQQKIRPVGRQPRISDLLVPRRLPHQEFARRRDANSMIRYISVSRSHDVNPVWHQAILPLFRALALGWETQEKHR